MSVSFCPVGFITGRRFVSRRSVPDPSLLVFREKPLFSFAYNPYEKKLLKSARSAQICQQKYPPPGLQICSNLPLQICSHLPVEDIYTKDLLPARVTILF